MAIRIVKPNLTACGKTVIIATGDSAILLQTTLCWFLRAKILREFYFKGFCIG